MALKDLVADTSKIDEEMIEKIISNYIRYDPKVKKIIFTPEGGALKNNAKILTYLVALLGWRYVTDEVVSVSTKPADLETVLAIPGGSLRPALKSLKDAHLVYVDDGHYKTQAANLDSIQKAISGEKLAAKKSRKPKDAKNPSSEKVNDKEKKGRKSASGDLQPLLQKWISESFFDEAKTIGELKTQYHEHAIIVKTTSLSGLLLKAVREGHLTRSKVDKNGRSVWGYKKS